jgi:hypothetical protein
MSGIKRKNCTLLCSRTQYVDQRKEHTLQIVSGKRVGKTNQQQYYLSGIAKDSVHTPDGA